MMDLEKKELESYLKNEVEPVFPVIFKRVHCKETIISKSEKEVLHNKLIRNFKSLEQILDHRDVSFFMI